MAKMSKYPGSAALLSKPKPKPKPKPKTGC